MGLRSALVVDADEVFAQKLVGLLRSLGFVAEVVRSGDGAVKRLQDRRFDLVVTELSLPGVDGFGVVAALRKQATAQETRAVVVSAFVAQRTLASQQKQQLGIDTVLARGGALEGLLRQLQRALPPPAPASASSSADESYEIELVDEEAGAAAAPASDRPARVAAVERAKSTSGDAMLDAIVDEAAHAFDVDLAMINLIHADHAWVEAQAGPQAGLVPSHAELPRAGFFCHHLVDADAVGTLVVPDAALHPLFRKAQAVTDGVLRSYVGAPLVTPEGHVLGSLCLVDRRPARLGSADVDRLQLFARRAAGLLALREHAVRDAALVADLRQRLALVEEQRDQLLATARRLAALLDSVDVGLCVFAPHNSSNSDLLLYANQQLGSFLGVDAAVWRGQPRARFVADLGAAAADERALQTAMAAPDAPFAATAEIALLRPQRRVLRWSTKPVLLDGVTLQLATFTDITAEADLAAARAAESRIDPLTALLNRRGFSEDVQRELARSRRSNSPLTVALFDLDHFKKVNDTWGHAAGDDVLRAVAGVLRRELRAIDLAARWGGEEFVCCFPDCSVDDARVIAERVRAAVEKLVLPTGPLTISAGIAPVDATVMGIDAAVAQADARLYEAKAAGRNRVL